MIESPAARQATKPPLIQVFGIGGVAAALVASVIALFATSTAAGAHSVVYRVSGSGTAETISYITDGVARPPVSGRQHADVELPWETQFTLPHGDLGFVSVIAQGDGSGELTVRIEVDERLIEEVTAAGRDRAVATADLSASSRP